MVDQALGQEIGFEVTCLREPDSVAISSGEAVTHL